MVFLILAVLTVILAAGAILFGWRGRIIDDHPLCRKCGFDLFGRPEGVWICSECGADLTDPRAITHGHRQRRSGWIMAGMGLLFLGVVPLIGIGTAMVTNFDPVPYQPAWWVMRNAKQQDLPKRRAGLAELTRRVRAREVTSEELAPFLDELLAMQADSNFKWHTDWGNFIDEADYLGALDEHRRQRYWSQGLGIEISFRKYIRRGDRLPWYVMTVPLKLGETPEVFARREGEELLLSGIPYQWRQPKPPVWSLVWNPSSVWTELHIEDMYDRLKDGPQTAEYTATMVVGPNPDDDQPPIATFTVKARCEWTILPADAMLVIPTKDESQVEVLRNAIMVEQPLTSRDQTKLTIRGMASPVQLYHSVHIRVGNEEYDGAFPLRVDVGKKIDFSIFCNKAELTAKTVDIVLRPIHEPPDWQFGRRLGADELVNVWDHEVVFKDVPIVRRPLLSP